MEIKQFEDKHLAHYSYAVVSDCERKIILIDPARDIAPYLQFAAEAEAKIVGVIETHPHADFVSGHLELHEATGATLYVSRQAHAHYPHQSFDEGQTLELGKIRLTALSTPGHSPDGISILLEHEGRQKAVFTGDTLFIGDCGRPDLREEAGGVQSKREDLARRMYHSLRDKLMPLEEHVVVYPAHGAGTLCGKNLSKESSSTIGRERQTNWSLQPASEEAFIAHLLADQPFVPRYFPYDVELNRKGAPGLERSLSGMGTERVRSGWQEQEEGSWIVDVRNEREFKEGHLPGALNLMEEGKFETWLGSILAPGERFYLAGRDEDQVRRMMQRAASIGYEAFLAGGLILEGAALSEGRLDVAAFGKDPGAYTIVDVRNPNEAEEKSIFKGSLSIPLAELRRRAEEVPSDKPVVVHCAGGYRSAAGASLLRAHLPEGVPVFDLGEAVKKFG